MHVADELQLEAKQLPPLNVKPSASSMVGDPTPPINSSRALIAEVRCLPPPTACMFPVGRVHAQGMYKCEKH